MEERSTDAYEDALEDDLDDACNIIRILLARLGKKVEITPEEWAGEDVLEKNIWIWENPITEVVTVSLEGE